MMPLHLHLPLKGKLPAMKPGEFIMVSGVLYALRDAAHKRLQQMLAAGQELPLDLKGQAIYYMGPTPPPPGRTAGAAGPTTSRRMDSYVPMMLQQGVKVMIGKGERSASVNELTHKVGACYLAAVGGAGAYLSERIESMTCVAFPELGPEAIYELKVKDFPVFVVTV